MQVLRSTGHRTAARLAGYLPSLCYGRRVNKVTWRHRVEMRHHVKDRVITNDALAGRRRDVMALYDRKLITNL